MTCSFVHSGCFVEKNTLWSHVRISLANTFFEVNICAEKFLRLTMPGELQTETNVARNWSVLLIYDIAGGSWHKITVQCLKTKRILLSSGVISALEISKLMKFHKKSHSLQDYVAHVPSAFKLPTRENEKLFHVKRQSIVKKGKTYNRLCESVMRSEFTIVIT